MIHKLPPLLPKTYRRNLNYRNEKHTLGTIPLGKKETEFDLESKDVKQIDIHSFDLYGKHLGSQRVWIDENFAIASGVFETEPEAPTVPEVAPTSEGN